MGYFGIFMLCPGFKEKGLLRLLRVAMVIQWILNRWLILNKVSPFFTLYSSYWISGLVVERVESVAPKTWGEPASVFWPEDLLNTIQRLLIVRPRATNKKTKEESFNNLFFE